MLTRKQNMLLQFIHDGIQKNGFSPSFDEMKNAFNFASKSSVHRLVNALEDRGFIRRLEHRARAIEVISMPRDFTPRRIQTKGVALVEIPVMGLIAAGVPISAIQRWRHNLMVPSELFGSENLFALEVRGDSMIDAGISDRDTVILRNTSFAISGDIVLAIVDDEEATLKRYRQRGSSVALEAANIAYETRIFGPNRVRIHGKLIGLIRKYS